MVDIRIISLGAGTKYIIKSQVRHWTVTITHTGGCGSKCRVQVGISMWEKWFGWYSTVRLGVESRSSYRIVDYSGSPLG